MKLLNCLNCHDIRKITRQWRKCRCGLSRARYLRDGLNAEVAGPARLLGIDNHQYLASVANGMPDRPYSGAELNWWVINPDWPGSHVKKLVGGEDGGGGK